MSKESSEHELFRLNGTGRNADLQSPSDLVSSSFSIISKVISSRSVYHGFTWHQLSKTLVSHIKSFLYAFVPQFIRTRWFDDKLHKPTKLSPTAWMNGMRGLAALIVVGYHYLYAFQYDIILGLWTDPNKRSYIYQIPPIPMLIDGTWAVQMFFIIAGYVCSYTSLHNMTRQDHQAIFRTLPASVFRRFFRLYLPSMTSLFCISILAYCGAYEATRSYFATTEQWKQYFPGLMFEPHPQRFPTLILQLQELWKQIFNMGNVWTERNYSPNLDLHLWTIINEFRGSMHLYIALLGLARCKPYARIFWLALLGYIEAFQWPHQECLPFFAGAIIAQLDVLRRYPGDMQSTNERSRYTKWLPQVPAVVWTPIRTFAYTFALYLMCYPYKEWDSPSYLYAWMKAWIPDTYGRRNAHILPRQIGCIILVYLLTTIREEHRRRSVWHRVLTSEFALYLGSIMFGLYLTQTMVLHLFGYFLPHWIWARIGGNEDNWRYVGVLFFAYLVNITLCLWVADVWTREVEGRLTRLTKWLENLCFEEM